MNFKQRFSIFRIATIIFFSALITLNLPVLSALAKGYEGRSNRPTIALVLGGGGARGAAHAGIIKVLEENNVPIDFVIGTSMGAVVGGLYASGMSPDDMYELLGDIDWDDLFSDRPSEEYMSFRNKKDEQRLMAFELGVSKDGIKIPTGIIAGQKLEFMLQRLTLNVADVSDFNNLPIPFRSVATDLAKGEPFVFDKGNLAQAIRASMSIPGAFPPVEYEGKVLTDGYAVDNVPVDVAKELGADIVIAVSVDEPLKDTEELKNLLDVTAQVMSILAQQNVQHSIDLLGDKDLFIHPDLGDTKTTDYNKTYEIAQMGEKAAREIVDKIKKYSVSDKEYQKYLAHHRSREFEPFTVDFVDVEKPKRVSVERVKGAIKAKPGDEFDAEKLKKDLTRVYAIGDFQTVTFNVEERDDEKGILIKTKEKSWGPNYLRFGLNLSSDTEEDAEFTFLTDFRMTELNNLGAEWRTQLQLGESRGVLTEWYQPLDPQELFFINPYFLAQERLENLYRGNNRIAEYRIDELGGGVDLGMNFGTAAEARVGIVRSLLSAEVNVGGTGLPDFDDVDKAALVARFDYDQFDNHTFPKKGIQAHAWYFFSDEGLGADISYDKLKVGVAKATTFGKKHTLIAALDAGFSLDEDTPLYDQFTLGGFLNLSGLSDKQLRGQHMGLARLIYFYRLGQSMGFAKNIHLGLSAEAGNTWNDLGDMGTEDLRFGGSAFIGVDTLIGPLYLGYGLAESSEGRVYLFLGKTF